MSFSNKLGKYVEYEVLGKDADETSGSWVSRGHFDTRVAANREAHLLKGFGWKTKIRKVVERRLNPLQNPARSNPKSASLKNFTGTITKNKNGTVTVRGKGKRK